MLSVIDGLALQIFNLCAKVVIFGIFYVLFGKKMR
jgi:hypothetical protein